MISRCRADTTIRVRRHLRQSTDGNMHRFKEFILGMITDPINTDNYDNELLVDQQPTIEPTYLIVELPKPQDNNQPETGEANIYNIPRPGDIANVVEHSLLVM